MPSEDEKRQALRSMFAQTREGQVQQRPPEPVVRDLAGVRPVVQQAVTQQEANARQVFAGAMEAFLTTKPEVAAEMRRADSQLLRFHKMTEGSQ